MKQRTRILIDAPWFICVFLCIQLLTSVIAMAVNQEWASSPNGMCLSLLCSSVITAVLFWAMKWWRESMTIIKSISWRVYLIAAILGIVNIPVALWLNEICGIEENEQIAQQFGILLQSPISLILLSIIVPITEEIVFRGAFLNKILIHQRNELGTSHLKGISLWLPILASAAVFGLAHFNIAQFVHAFLFGILLGWIYYKTSSILPAVAFHIINNGVVAMVMLINPEVEDATLLDLFNGDKTLMYSTIAGCSILIASAIFALNRVFKTTE